MLSHIFFLSTLYPQTPVVPQPKDGCLITFPNYVTGSLVGVECTYEVYTKVESLLKLAHAERYYKSPPPAIVSEHQASEMLKIHRSTLRGWVAKGWIYRWVGSNYEYVFSLNEVQALQLARPRTVLSSAKVKAPQVDQPHRLQSSRSNEINSSLIDVGDNVLFNLGLSFGPILA